MGLFFMPENKWGQALEKDQLLVQQHPAKLLPPVTGRISILLHNDVVIFARLGVKPDTPHAGGFVGH